MCQSVNPTSTDNTPSARDDIYTNTYDLNNLTYWKGMLDSPQMPTIAQVIQTPQNPMILTQKEKENEKNLDHFFETTETFFATAELFV